MPRRSPAVLVIGACVLFATSTHAVAAKGWKDNLLRVAPLQMKTWKQEQANKRMINQNAARPAAKRLPVPPPIGDGGSPACPNHTCDVPAGYLPLDMTGSYYMGNNVQWQAYAAARSRVKTPKQRRTFFALKNNPYRFATTNCSAYTAWVIDRAVQGRMKLFTAYAETQWTEAVAKGGVAKVYPWGSTTAPPPPGGWRAGDLVFFNTYDANNDGNIDDRTHVGIMVSKTAMFHSSSRTNAVSKVELKDYMKVISRGGLSAYGYVRLPDRFA